MLLKTGSIVTLTSSFGIWHGIQEYPDVNEQGKIAKITGFDEHGYFVEVDDGGEYGRVSEEAVKLKYGPIKMFFYNFTWDSFMASKDDSKSEGFWIGLHNWLFNKE